MASRATSIVAKIAWLLPAFFLFLTINQAIVALDLRETLNEGEEVSAEVLEVHQENRVDVTFDYISLRAELANGQIIEQEKMSLPHSLVPLVADRDVVTVRVLPGADQEMVITDPDIASRQWRIAAFNAAMAGGAALIFAIGVFFWNRMLRREGDPAERGVEEPDPEHPARAVARSEESRAAR